MKSKRYLTVIRLICVLALILAVYCFWLMTVPLDYDLVYVVLIGFILSLGVFVVTLITSVIIAIHLRRSRASPPDIAPRV